MAVVRPTLPGPKNQRRLDAVIIPVGAILTVTLVLGNPGPPLIGAEWRERQNPTGLAGFRRF